MKNDFTFENDQKRGEFEYHLAMSRLPCGFKRDYAVGLCSNPYILHLNFDCIYLQNDIQKKINILNNKRVMLIQGNLAKNYLFENLKMFCYLTKFVAYNTKIIKIVNRELEELLNKEKTYSVFTSSSGFLSFDQLYDAKKTSIISIGNSTSSFIKERGYEPMVTSKMQSYEGISDTIISYLIKD